jgi:hypothetical protein
VETSTHVNLFAVQPRASLDDDASLKAFTARHSAFTNRVHSLRARNERGRPLHAALVVWPEMLGAPLALMGHLHRPRSLEESLFSAMAPRGHRARWTLFFGIAWDCGLWVAGTALLPCNRLGNEGPGFVPQGM